MLTPMPITFYVYADDEAQVKRLEKSLHDFVNEMYNRGSLVTAEKMSGLIDKFGSNPVAQAFL